MEEFKSLPISDVALSLGIAPETMIPYGFTKAKVPLSVLDAPRKRDGKGRLVLVSAITPTPAGEGKTTTSIGLADGMKRLGESVCLALREPSLGPCMGVKGGATGGGLAMLTPRVEINLHFTGDFHAITAAHNLLSAMADNHAHFRLEPLLDARRIRWPRVLDVNDRALRHVVTGLGGPMEGVPREASFDITAASEIMAILCLAQNEDDLRERLGAILVGAGPERTRVFARDIGAVGAMMALLKDAMMPNLVQSEEGTPALVHGGPFANIAHGCNSVLATRMAQHLADWTITEAGFALDLGGEKFFDIKCVSAGLTPNVVVLVATVRALKMHGGIALKDLTGSDPEAVLRGLPNLEKHIETVGHFGVPLVVAINRFLDDSDEEIQVIEEFCKGLGVRVAMSDHFAKGGLGAKDLAQAVLDVGSTDDASFTPLYDWKDGVAKKIESVAKKAYGADGVIFTQTGKRALRRIKAMGFEGLPICIAKTQNSLSDNPRLKGRPTGFDVTVVDIKVAAGAGYLVVLTGDISRMPGLPRKPQALKIDLVNGKVEGLR